MRIARQLLRHPALLTLLVCGSLFLPVADAAAMEAPALPAPRILAPYPWPAFLARSPVLITDLSSGDVGLLGARTVAMRGGPHGIAIQPGGAFVWVMNSGGSNVWVFDRQLRHVVASITVGHAPVHAVFSPDGATAYVTNFGGSEITIVNVATHQAIGSISTPSQPHGIAISPDGRTLYVACVTGGALAVLDTRTRQMTHTLLLVGGGAPYGVTLSPDGRRVYLTEALFRAGAGFRRRDYEIPGRRHGWDPSRAHHLDSWDQQPPGRE